MNDSNKITEKFFPYISVLFIAAVLVFSGCSSMGPYEKYDARYSSGDFKGAAATIKDENPTDGGASTLDNLLIGSAEFVTADFKDSISSFDKAEHGLKEQDESFFDFGYVGTTYDGIFQNAYKGLAFLAQGEVDNARVEFRRADIRQGRAANRNAVEIRKRQEQIAKLKKEKSNENAVAANSASAALNNPLVKAEAQKYSEWGAYADFVNPGVLYLCGVVETVFANDKSDFDSANKAFSRSKDMSGAQVSAFGAGLTENGDVGKVDDYVFVVFENGLGPTKVEKKTEVRVPMPDGIIYVGVALPELVKRNLAWPYLECRDASGNILARTETVCEVDRLVATEFSRQYPSIVASSVFSAVFKTVLQVALREAARKAALDAYDKKHKGKKDYNETIRKWQGDAAALLVSIPASIISEMTTYADIRTWSSLPKEYQGAIFKRPENGKLEFKSPNGAAFVASVALPEKGPYFIYVKQVSQSSSPLIICLSPSTAAALAAEACNNSATTDKE